MSHEPLDAGKFRPHCSLESFLEVQFQGSVSRGAGPVMVGDRREFRETFVGVRMISCSDGCIDDLLLKRT